MRKRFVSLPELALIGATRGMLGIGIGLLLSSHISERHRRIAGSVLAGAGVLSTIPLALQLFRRRRVSRDEPRPLYPPGDQPYVRRSEQPMTH